MSLPCLPLPALLAGAVLALATVQAQTPAPDAFLTTAPPATIYHEGWIDLNKNGQRDPYEDASLAEDARIADLLGRMNLDEKTAQMTTLYGFSRVLKDELPTPAWKDRLWKDGIGNIDEHINGNEGWTQNLPDPANDLPWSRHARALNTVQRWFIEGTRLGIPVDFTNEGIRGLMHSGATSFTAELGIASTWNPALVHEIGRVTGQHPAVVNEVPTGGPHVLVTLAPELAGRWEAFQLAATTTELTVVGLGRPDRTKKGAPNDPPSIDGIEPRLVVFPFHSASIAKPIEWKGSPPGG